MEDDVVSEAPKGRRPNSKDPELKFTDWLKQQNFGEEINRKIIEAIIDVSKSASPKIIAKSADKLPSKMGYTKGRMRTGPEATSSTGDVAPKSATTTVDMRPEQPISSPVASKSTVAPATETPGLSEKAKQLYKSLETASGEDLAQMLTLGGENRTLHGGARQLMAIYKFASPALQNKIKKYVSSISDVLAHIPAIKDTYKSFTPERAESDLESAIGSYNSNIENKKQLQKVNVVKPEVTPSDAAGAPVEPKEELRPEQIEQKAINHIKQQIKTAFLGNSNGLQITRLYKAGLVDPKNVIDLLQKARQDPETEKYIQRAGTSPKEAIFVKKPSEVNSPARVPSKEPAPEPATKATEPVISLSAYKDIVSKIYEKYAKLEGDSDTDIQKMLKSISASKDEKDAKEYLDGLETNENIPLAYAELEKELQNPSVASKEIKTQPISTKNPEEVEEEPEEEEEDPVDGEESDDVLDLADEELSDTDSINAGFAKDEQEDDEEEKERKAKQRAAAKKAKALKADIDKDAKKNAKIKESLTRPMFTLKEGVFRLNK